jgi:hypothetical protein
VAAPLRIGEDKSAGPTPFRPLSGVISDQVVELGGQGGGPQLRVIEVHAEGKVLLLATTRLDLPAHLIALIYRYRWQIELFFKWFKTMLPCRHWIAESPPGVAIQVYTVMIASLLLMLWTGRRPNKRQMEALRLYWMGFITERELTEVLGLEKINKFAFLDCSSPEQFRAKLSLQPIRWHKWRS